METSEFVAFGEELIVNTDEIKAIHYEKQRDYWAIILTYTDDKTKTLCYIEDDTALQNAMADIGSKLNAVKIYFPKQNK